MNVLLLGNGFDLNHDLPTLYNDFLQTVNFLMNRTVMEGDTIGKIFGNLQLQIKSEHIEKCYLAHKESYNQTNLEVEEIDKIINLAQDNIWFTYLFRTVKEETQWIDVECKCQYKNVQKVENKNVQFSNFYSSACASI